MTGDITTEVDGSICTVTISNPDKKNAMSRAMLAELNDELADLSEREGLYALVFTGAGKDAFSSGLDISEFSEENPKEGEDRVKEMLRLVEEFPYPTIAMINGDAVGAGFELATACDLRVATAGARLGITPAKIGIVISDRAIRQLLAAVGPADAKELLFTGKLIDATRAEEMGLLNDVVEQPELDERTYELAEQIASNAPLSLKGMKSIIRTVLDKRKLTPTEKRWADELQEEAFESRDHAEGRAAFAENRPPEFEGR